MQLRSLFDGRSQVPAPPGAGVPLESRGQEGLHREAGRGRAGRRCPGNKRRLQDSSLSRKCRYTHPGWSQPRNPACPPTFSELAWLPSLCSQFSAFKKFTLTGGPPIRRLTEASVSSIRGQTEEARKNHSPTVTESKARYRQLISVKKQKVTPRLLGMRRNPRKTTK